MENNIKIMNGIVNFFIYAKNKKIEKEIFEFCKKEIVRLVNIFNFFDKKSALSILNKNKKVVYSFELDFLLKESIKAYELTNGFFNIFLGKQIEERKKNKKEKNFDIFNFKNVENLISSDKKSIYFNSNNLKIDLGGIAKGYIVDELIGLVKKKFKTSLRKILINARGDIGVFSKDKPFKIGVENPFNLDRDADFIELKSGNLITSGHTKQFFKGGSHILGNKSDILTITLISEKENCYMLDLLGTYFTQLSSQEVLELIDFKERFKNIECFIILENGKVLKSSFWEMYTYN